MAANGVCGKEPDVSGGVHLSANKFPGGNFLDRLAPEPTKTNSKAANETQQTNK